MVDCGCCYSYCPLAIILAFTLIEVTISYKKSLVVNTFYYNMKTDDIVKNKVIDAFYDTILRVPLIDLYMIAPWAFQNLITSSLSVVIILRSLKSILYVSLLFLISLIYCRLALRLAYLVYVIAIRIIICLKIMVYS